MEQFKEYLAEQDALRKQPVTGMDVGPQRNLPGVNRYDALYANKSAGTQGMLPGVDVAALQRQPEEIALERRMERARKMEAARM